MDYDGQRRAEKIFQTIIMVFAIVGLVWGYIVQQFSQTVYILAAGFLVSCLLTLPPWPLYRRKPLPWQKPVEESTTQESQVQKGKKKAK